MYKASHYLCHVCPIYISLNKISLAASRADICCAPTLNNNKIYFSSNCESSLRNLMNVTKLTDIQTVGGRGREGVNIIRDDGGG